MAPLRVRPALRFTIALVNALVLAAGAHALEAPTDVQGVPLGPTSVQVTWQDNSSDEAVQIVQRALSGSGTWADVSGSLPENQTAFTDITADEGTSYAYRVRVCRPTCAGGGTMRDSLASPDVVTPLFAPTGASATYVQPQHVALAWTDVSLRNTAYTVERKATVDVDWEVLTSSLDGASTSYADTSAVDGRSYGYRVTATRTSPTSLSAPALASADTPWIDPSGLSATLDTYARPVLAWQDNSSGELAYVIERRNDLGVYDCPVEDQRGDGWCEVGQAPSNPSGGVTQFVDTSLRIDPVDPAEYQYRVHAVAGSAASADASAWSPSCTAEPPAEPLAAWTSARTANGSPIWPLAIPAPTDTTTVSAARRGAEATLSWNDCNDGTFPPPAACDWEPCTLGSAGCESPELILLSSSRYVALFTWRGALIGLTHRLHGSEFIHPSGGWADTPHGWTIRFGSATTKAGKGTALTSQSFSTPNPTISFADGALSFEWEDIPNFGRTIHNTWRLDAVGDSGLRGRMQVTATENAAGDFPIDVHFPQVTQLSNAWTDADFVQPGGPGSVRTGVDLAGGTQPAPSWTSQFLGFSQGKDALYLAMEDPAHHPKQFSMNQDVLSTFVLFPESVVAPADFSMDYDAVLVPMCVESRSHAPIRLAKRYRRFMLASDWLERPGETQPVRLVDRTDIPTKLRDGVFWWTQFMVKMTIYGDGLTFDADGPNWRVVGINDATGATGCGTPCLVVRYDNGDGTYANYRRVYKDLPTGGVYVYPNDGNPSQYLPTDRIYIDLQDPNWELLEGRQLENLFDIGAEWTRDKFLFDTSKWACYLRTSTPASAPQTPIGFHVYEWYTPGFSKGNPLFDMVPGFNLAIDAVEGPLGPWSFQGTSCEGVAAGDNVVLPYINSGWGDVSDLYTAAGANPDYGQSELVLPWAMRFESGQHWCESGVGCTAPSGGQMLARMSGGAPAWRAYVAGIAENVFDPGPDGVRAQAIYLDTYGGNFGVDGNDDVWSQDDAPRDHAPGRGLWHVTGERAIGELVRQQKPNGVGLVAAEHASEAFLSNVDLITWYPPVRPTDFPLMQTVYSGYRMFAGPVASSVREESVDAYAMKAGGNFVAGNQIGIANTTPFTAVNGPWVSTEGQEMLDYANRLARARLGLKCYLAYGELLGYSDPDPAVPPAQTIQAEWFNWNGDPSQLVTRTRIRGSRWVSSADGGCSAGRAIVLTNTTAADEQAHIPVPGNWADTTPSLCLPDDSGCTQVALEAGPGGGWQTATVTVPARDVRYLRFGP